MIALATEVAWLQQHGLESSWIKITGPDDLQDFSGSKL
jgi:hypothetical protein